MRRKPWRLTARSGRGEIMIHGESAPGQTMPTLCSYDGGMPAPLPDGARIDCFECKAILAAFGRRAEEP